MNITIKIKKYITAFCKVIFVIQLKFIFFFFSLFNKKIRIYGGPRRTRIPNPKVRSFVLYPIELAVHVKDIIGHGTVCKNYFFSNKYSLAKAIQIKELKPDMKMLVSGGLLWVTLKAEI